MATSKRAQIKAHRPGLLLPVWKATPDPHSTGGPPALAGRSGQSPAGSLPPSLGSWCTQHFVPSQTVSLNPVEVMESNPAGLQSHIPWEFLVPLPGT